MSRHNPIRFVNGAEIYCPSVYKWALEDLSSSDAGRTEDTVMDKMRIGQIVKIELAWNGLTTEKASKVLKAFNEEYLEIEYLDPLQGQYIKSEFYVGNRTAPLYNSEKGVWQNVSFNIIERSGVRNVSDK